MKSLIHEDEIWIVVWIEENIYLRILELKWSWRSNFDSVISSLLRNIHFISDIEFTY